MLALILPTTAALYIAAEWANPKGTGQSTVHAVGGKGKASS